MYGQAEEMERVIRKRKNGRSTEVSHLDETKPFPYLRAHHLVEGIRTSISRPFGTLNTKGCKSTQCSLIFQGHRELSQWRRELLVKSTFQRCR